VEGGSLTMEAGVGNLGVATLLVMFMGLEVGINFRGCSGRRVE
jgi:hypothetical protein